jgi:hypothetical protein
MWATRPLNSAVLRAFLYTPIISATTKDASEVVGQNKFGAGFWHGNFVDTLGMRART